MASDPAALCRLVEKLQQQTACVICKQTPNTVVSSKCGHLFCHACAMKHIGNRSSIICPKRDCSAIITKDTLIANDTITEAFSHLKHLVRLSSSIKVRSSGLEVTVPTKELKDVRAKETSGVTKRKKRGSDSNAQMVSSAHEKLLSTGVHFKAAHVVPEKPVVRVLPTGNDQVSAATKVGEWLKDVSTDAIATPDPAAALLDTPQTTQSPHISVSQSKAHPTISHVPLNGNHGDEAQDSASNCYVDPFIFHPSPPKPTVSRSKHLGSRGHNSVKKKEMLIYDKQNSSPVEDRPPEAQEPSQMLLFNSQSEERMKQVEKEREKLFGLAHEKTSRYRTRKKKQSPVTEAISNLQIKDDIPLDLPTEARIGEEQRLLQKMRDAENHTLIIEPSLVNEQVEISAPRKFYMGPKLKAIKAMSGTCTPQPRSSVNIVSPGTSVPDVETSVLKEITERCPPAQVKPRVKAFRSDLQSASKSKLPIDFNASSAQQVSKPTGERRQRDDKQSQHESFKIDEATSTCARHVEPPQPASPVPELMDMDTHEQAETVGTHLEQQELDAAIASSLLESSCLIENSEPVETRVNPRAGVLAAGHGDVPSHKVDKRTRMTSDAADKQSKSQLSTEPTRIPETVTSVGVDTPISQKLTDKSSPASDSQATQMSQSTVLFLEKLHDLPPKRKTFSLGSDTGDIITALSSRDTTQQQLLDLMAPGAGEQPITVRQPPAAPTDQSAMLVQPSAQHKQPAVSASSRQRKSRRKTKFLKPGRLRVSTVKKSIKSKIIQLVYLVPANKRNKYFSKQRSSIQNLTYKVPCPCSCGNYIYSACAKIYKKRKPVSDVKKRPSVVQPEVLLTQAVQVAQEKALPSSQPKPLSQVVQPCGSHGSQAVQSPQEKARPHSQPAAERPGSPIEQPQGLAPVTQAVQVSQKVLPSSQCECAAAPPSTQFSTMYGPPHTLEEQTPTNKDPAAAPVQQSPRLLSQFAAAAESGLTPHSQAEGKATSPLSATVTSPEREEEDDDDEPSIIEKSQEIICTRRTAGISKRLSAKNEPILDPVEPMEQVYTVGSDDVLGASMSQPVNTLLPLEYSSQKNASQASENGEEVNMLRDRPRGTKRGRSQVISSESDDEEAQESTPMPEAKYRSRLSMKSKAPPGVVIRAPSVSDDSDACAVRAVAQQDLACARAATTDFIDLDSVIEIDSSPSMSNISKVGKKRQARKKSRLAPAVTKKGALMSTLDGLSQDESIILYSDNPFFDKSVFTASYDSCALPTAAASREVEKAAATAAAAAAAQQKAEEVVSVEEHCVTPPPKLASDKMVCESSDSDSDGCIDFTPKKKADIRKEVMGQFDQVHRKDTNIEAVSPVVPAAAKSDELPGIVAVETTSFSALKSPATSTRKDLNLIYSSLNDKETDTIQNFVAKFSNVHHNHSFRKETTHLIVPCHPDGCALSTLKFLIAVARGLWVVSIQWVQDSMKVGELLPEKNYEMLDQNGSDGPRRSRIAKGNLFKDIEFFCCDTYYQELSKQNVEMLISESGGKLLSDVEMEEPKKRKMRLIIVPKPEILDIPKACLTWKWPMVSKDWLVGSLEEFRLLPLYEYLSSREEEEAYIQAQPFPATMMQLPEDDDSYISSSEVSSAH